MESVLFNALMRLRAIRDLIVAEGPTALRAASDVLTQAAGWCQNIADYVESVGPLVQFAPGSGHIDSDKSKEYMAEIVAIKGEIEAAVAKANDAGEALKAEHQRQLDNNVQAGILDWANRLDPATKAILGNLVLSLINKLLVKSGFPTLDTSPKIKAVKPTAKPTQGVGGK